MDKHSFALQAICFFSTRGTILDTQSRKQKPHPTRTYLIKTTLNNCTALLLLLLLPRADKCIGSFTLAPPRSVSVFGGKISLSIAHSESMKPISATTPPYRYFFSGEPKENQLKSTRSSRQQFARAIQHYIGNCTAQSTHFTSQQPVSSSSSSSLSDRTR